MLDYVYKERLLDRVCKYLQDNYVDYRVVDKDRGIIYINALSNNSEYPSMIYNPFEAEVIIDDLNLEFECVIKERALQIFKQYFKE